MAAIKKAARQTSTSERAALTPFDKVSRYATAKGEQKRIIAEFHQLQINGFDVSKLEECATFFKVRQSIPDNQFRIAGANFCKQRFVCHTCETRKAVNYLAKYHEKFVHVAENNPDLTPYLITFTVKNQHEFMAVEHHLSQSFTRYQRKAQSAKRSGSSHEWNKVKGWVSTEEFTYSPVEGWHPHLHVLVFSTSSFNYKKLKSEWLEVTGDSHVVNVTPIDTDNTIKSLCEVFKYTLKASQLTAQQLYDVAQKMKGRRLVRNGGLLRGVQVDEFANDDLTDGNGHAYIDHYMRYNGKHYEIYKTQYGIQ
jgi:plasmid rolling circle replication initiator protein Rep